MISGTMTRKSFLSLLGMASVAVASGIKEKMPKECIFTGAVDSDWTNPKNWLGRRQPSIRDDIIIGATCDMSMCDSIEVGNLTIVKGASVTFPSMATLNSMDNKNCSEFNIQPGCLLESVETPQYTIGHSIIN